MFGHGKPLGEIGQSSHEGLIARATRLCKELHSDPSKLLAKHLKGGGRKRKQECVKEEQKNLIVIDYPGPDIPEVVPLHEDEKVFDGSIRYSSNMDEDDIREEIAQMLREKKSSTHDLTYLSSNDFTFVKCVNKKVRVPDGDSPFDFKGICRIYPHGAIYVCLNKPMCTQKVCDVVVIALPLLKYLLVGMNLVGKYCKYVYFNNQTTVSQVHVLRILPGSVDSCGGQSHRWYSKCLRDKD